MTTRNGKIARLPKAIREQLNQRLEEGETAVSLVDWLNALPEVQKLVKDRFGGHPIREQNVSQWKQGGFQEWLRHQEALELAQRLYERADELECTGEEEYSMNEVLSLWLSARYAVATQEIEAAEGPEAWKQLQQMCGNVAKLRRLDQQAQRLAQQAEQLKLEAQRIEVQREAVKIEREQWEAVRAENAEQHIPTPKPECDWEAGVDVQKYQEFQQWFREQSDQQKIDWVRHPQNWARIRPMTETERQAKMKEMTRSPAVMGGQGK